jgi:hypothetical protein
LKKSRTTNEHLFSLFAGVMKKDDMKWLFRGIKQQMDDDVPSYIINLLQKFEVVLLWDNENLIVPSLLPNECDLKISPSVSYETKLNCIRPVNFEQHKVLVCCLLELDVVNTCSWLC